MANSVALANIVPMFKTEKVPLKTLGLRVERLSSKDTVLAPIETGPKILIPAPSPPASASTTTVALFPSTHLLFKTKVNPIDATPAPKFDTPPDV
jgi:hypothetical protein